MDAQSARAKRIEARVMYQTVAGPPDDARAATAIPAVRTGEGVAVTVRGDPTDYWPKASVPESCATGRRAWITRPLTPKARDDADVLPGRPEDPTRLRGVEALRALRDDNLWTRRGTG